MNFLAHIALSNKIDDVLIGNIIEDFVVGRIDHPRNQWISQPFKVGIGLHRLIDTMTDADEAVSDIKKKLSEKHKKFAPVLVDIFFDFFLTHHWAKFYGYSLDSVCTHAYATFNQNAPLCPMPMQTWISGLLKYQWLNQYGTHAGIQKALNNVATRTTMQNNMVDGLSTLIEHEKGLSIAFLDFYPRLQSACNAFLDENSNIYVSAN